MQDKHILVAGYGKLGRRVAMQLADSFRVSALKRSPQTPDAGVALCFADLNDPPGLSETLAQALPDGADYLLYCLSPSERSEAGYRAAYLNGLKNLLTAIPNRNALKHVIFVSSTSVYQQDSGEWVDEQSPCQPTSFSGKILLEAEQFLQRQAIKATIVRFSGIYGGSRSRLIDQVRHALDKDEVLTASPGFTNRIHEDDCVGFLCHLMTLLAQNKSVAPLYLGTDSEPVEQAEVYRFIAGQLQAELALEQRQTLKLEDSPETAKPRRAGSKRCANRLMLSTGYELRFPSFRQGYAQHLSDPA